MAIRLDSRGLRRLAALKRRTSAWLKTWEECRRENPRQDHNGRDRWPCRYVNVYCMVLCDGGPEEGGWTYDRLVPIHQLCRGFSTRRKAKREMRRHVERMHRKMDIMDAYDHEYDYTSVLGGEQYVVVVEDSPAEESPIGPVHYE